MKFDEFRLFIQTDVPNIDQWAIRVNCPQAVFNGSHGTVSPVVGLAEITRLRNSAAPPDLALLRQLGTNVLNSIMPPTVQLAFRACLDAALIQHRGLRLVVATEGETKTSGGISLLDLPLEAIFNMHLDFVATSDKTPVSRSVSAESDRAPYHVSLPIRILLVISEPTDLPPVGAAAERTAILHALAPLIDARAVVVDVCDPPTLAELNAKLQEVYHIVHFIGHGDYEVVGLDTNPQPHLYFEDGTPARRRKAADLAQVSMILRNGNVPLVILTACSSAAQSPNNPTIYPVVAFESLAQSLVGRQFGPLAAVAMQFDLETDAAEIFSRVFYSKLLLPESSLDAAVAQARIELVSKFVAGHRSWVNPAVYWRCKEGRVFEIADTAIESTPAQREELAQIDALLEVYLNQLEELSKEPAETRLAVANLQAQWEKKVEDLIARRGLVLGDSVRLRGGKPDANNEIECALTIRLRLPATIGDIDVKVQYELTDFDFIGNSAGEDTAANAVFLQSDPFEQIAVLIRNATNGVVWNPDEYELAKLKFRVKNPLSKPIIRLKIVNAEVSKNGIAQPFRSLDAVIFVG